MKNQIETISDAIRDALSGVHPARLEAIIEVTVTAGRVSAEAVAPRSEEEWEEMGLKEGDVEALINLRANDDDWSLDAYDFLAGLVEDEDVIVPNGAWGLFVDLARAAEADELRSYEF